MRFIRAAALAAVVVAGCATAPTPTVGTISSCGPGLDAATCRGLAQLAIEAYDGPALAADKVNVDVAASCDLDMIRMISSEAAASGVTCYAIDALAGNSGGRRISEGTYQGGTPVNIQSMVWIDATGEVHAATEATQ